MKKVCFRCKQEKDITEFHKNKRNIDGYKGTCKKCCRLYVDEHIEQKRQYEEEHREERKPKRNEYLKKYRETDKYKNYRESIKEDQKKYQKEYRQTEAYKISKKKSYLKNKDNWKKETPEHRNARERERYKNDLDFNIIKRKRSRFFKATHGKYKDSSVFEIIGCTINEFKEYFSRLFTKGMTWELYQRGKIHEDHIFPVVAFNMKDSIQVEACFYYKNFQPLWKDDNIRKRCTYKKEDKDTYMNWYITNIYKK